MISGTVKVDGGEIYYESRGSGIPVVFIHAGYLDSRMWDEQFDLFSRNYNVIRYDVRGFGRSTNPAGPYSDAADLKSLLGYLKIEKGMLIGVSNGGRISFDFAIENPGRVLAMVPIDYGISGFKTESAEEEHIWDMVSAQEGDYQNFLK